MPPPPPRPQGATPATNAPRAPARTNTDTLLFDWSLTRRLERRLLGSTQEEEKQEEEEALSFCSAHHITSDEIGRRNTDSWRDATVPRSILISVAGVTRQVLHAPPQVHVGGPEGDALPPKWSFLCRQLLRPSTTALPEPLIWMGFVPLSAEKEPGNRDAKPRVDVSEGVSKDKPQIEPEPPQRPAVSTMERPSTCWRKGWDSRSARNATDQSRIHFQTYKFPMLDLEVQILRFLMKGFY